MRTRPEPADVERLRQIVGERLGLHLEEVGDDALVELLRRCVEANPPLGVGR